MKLFLDSLSNLLFSMIIFLDRFTKYLAMTGSLPHINIPCLSYNVTFNRGITWGFLHTQNNLQFICISIIIVIIIAVLIIQTFFRWKKNEVIWPYILVLAGALSNMVDRIMFNGVIDFIEISYAGWTWPIFNVADMFIVIGIGCSILQELVNGEKYYE